MNHIGLKRAVAYILDIVFVSLISTLLIQLPYINPTYDEYISAQSQIIEIIDSDEVSDIVENQTYINLTYDLASYGMVYNITSIIIYLGYFVIFQYYNKGQTLGKKIMKIAIVEEKGEKLKIIQVFLRSLILYGIIQQVSSLILINILSPNSFIKIEGIISSIFILIFWICAISVLLKKDGITFYDKLLKTKVTNI